MTDVHVTVVDMIGDEIMKTVFEGKTRVCEIMLELADVRGCNRFCSLVTDAGELSMMATLAESGLASENITLTAVSHGTLGEVVRSCCDVVQVSGTLHHPYCSGTYVRTDLPTNANHGGHPIYKGPNHYFLYHWNGFWEIGYDYLARLPYEASACSIRMHPCEASNWVEWDGSRYVAQEALSVEVLESLSNAASFQSISDFRKAGFSARDLVSAVPQLCAKGLLNGGYSVHDLRGNHCFCAQELKDCDFTLDDVRFRFSVEELHLVFSLEEFARFYPVYAGTVAYLKRHGFSLQELLTMYPICYFKQERFTPEELIAAGCSVEELYHGGYSAAHLCRFGFSVQETSSTKNEETQSHNQDKERHRYKFIIAMSKVVILCVIFLISLPAWVALKLMKQHATVRRSGTVRYVAPRRRKNRSDRIEQKAVVDRQRKSASWATRSITRKA